MQIPFTLLATVAAGQYWIEAVYSANTNTGYTNTSSSIPTDYRSFTYSGTLPQTFGALTNYSANSFDYSVSTVPEPSTWALLAVGVVGLGLVLRQHRRTARLA